MFDSMVMQIPTFALTHLSLGSQVFFHDSVLKFIGLATPDALHLSGLVEPYEATVKKLWRVVKRSRAYIATGKMRAADAERDRLVGVIMNTVRTNLSNPLEGKRRAARHLKPVLSGFKGLAHHELTKQSAEIRSMLARFDKPENRAMAAELHIEEEIAALALANERFEAAHLEKIAEEGERVELSAIKSKPTLAAARLLYLNIVRTVNAYAIAAPSEAVTQFITQVSGVIASLVDEKERH